MKIGPRGLALIKKWEGYHKKLSNGSCVAYLDTLVKPAYRSKGYKGLWTIGYGCTEGVTEGLVWTEKQAEAALMKEIKKHEDFINTNVTYPINQHQFDALCSISYNLGTKGWKTLLNHVNNGDMTKAAHSFAMYNKAGGKVYKGLVSRRADEKELFEWEVPAEVYALSPQMRTSWRTRMATLASSFVGLFTWANLAEARQFFNDYAGIMLLGSAAVLIVVLKSFETKTIEDFDNDVYRPEGTK